MNAFEMMPFEIKYFEKKYYFPKIQKNIEVSD